MQRGSRSDDAKIVYIIIYDIVMIMSRGPQEFFPNRLRAARERRGLSQGGVAARTGLQVSAVSHFETGGRKPSFDNLRRLADALEVTTDYLLGRTGDMEGTVAAADRLYRDYAELPPEHREMADDFIQMLAQKAEKSRRAR